MDASVSTCPRCGTALITPASSKIWIVALVQIAMMTAFMLLFHFPKFTIVPLVVFILLATAASEWLKVKVTPKAPPAPQRTLAHPIVFRILAFVTVLCALGFISSLLFGFVIFMNSWNRWHQYEGQSYHQSEFQITQVYFQKGRKGAVDAYASGTVEGQREWMNLIPYLHQIPRSEAQLDDLVGPGITIPIFFFPKLKGRARVQFDDGIPPAEAARVDTIKALKYGFLGAALSAGMLFLLSRLRGMCYDNSAAALQAAYPAQIR